MKETEKGIMVHYLKSVDDKQFIKEFEDQLSEFKHVYYYTIEKSGFEIMKNPFHWEYPFEESNKQLL